MKRTYKTANCPLETQGKGWISSSGFQGGWAMMGSWEERGGYLSPGLRWRSLLVCFLLAVVRYKWGFQSWLHCLVDFMLGRAGPHVEVREQPLYGTVMVLWAFFVVHENKDKKCRFADTLEFPAVRPRPEWWRSHTPEGWPMPCWRSTKLRFRACGPTDEIWQKKWRNLFSKKLREIQLQ